MLAALLLAVIIVTRQRLWKQMMSDWVFRLALAYAALHLILLAWQPQGVLAAVAGLMIDLRYVAFFVLVYVLFRLTPSYYRAFVVTGVVGAAVVVGFGVLQLFLPVDVLAHIGYGKDTIAPYLTVDKNPDYVRINSTLRGPNPLGAYVLMVLTAIAAAVLRGQAARRFWWLGALAVASVVVLWVTYSRSAVLGAILALAIVVGLTVLRRIPRRAWIGGCVALGMIVGGLIALRDSEFVTHVVLHENRDGGSVVSSNDDHASSLVTGLERLTTQPLGAGIGSTGSASLHGSAPIIIENQYLFIAHEVGWLGLIGFIGLFVVVLVRLFRQRQHWLSLALLASGIGLAAIGFVQPVWGDDTVAMVWWGLAGVACGMHNKIHHDRRPTPHQEAARIT